MDSGTIPAAEAARTVRPASVGGRSARGWFAILVFLMLSTPLACQMLGLGPVDPGAENRALAPKPTEPHTLKDVIGFPGALDAYIRDWFGLRQPMVRANNWIRFHLFGEVTSPDLLIGKHGRIFMSAHPGNMPLSLIYDVCGAGVTQKRIDGAVFHIASLIGRAQQDAPDLAFVIVPTAAALYPEDLPRWAGAPCQGATPSVDRVLTDLSKYPDLMQRITYPIDALQDIKRTVPVIPKRNFHWGGEGTLKYAERLAETRLGMTHSYTLPLRTDDWPSDLALLNPGAGFKLHMPWPDFGKGGIIDCLGAPCDAAAGDDANAIAPLHRYSRQQPNGKRLLIISDSFGDNLAGDFVEYYGEVWQIHFNLLPPLTRPELDRRYVLAFRQFHPDRLIFICHDFGIFYVPMMMQDYFWPDRTRPAAR